MPPDRSRQRVRSLTASASVVSAGLVVALATAAATSDPGRPAAQPAAPLQAADAQRVLQLLPPAAPPVATSDGRRPVAMSGAS